MQEGWEADWAEAADWAAPEGAGLGLVAWAAAVSVMAGSEVTGAPGL